MCFGGRFPFYKSYQVATAVSHKKTVLLFFLLERECSEIEKRTLRQSMDTNKALLFALQAFYEGTPMGLLIGAILTHFY